MSLIFNLVLHVLLIGSTLAFLATMLMVAVRTSYPMERLKRALAIFAGALVVLGAQVSGVSFSAFTADSLSGAKASSAGAHIVAAVVPAITGAGLGFSLYRIYRRDQDAGMRVICFVGTLALATFAEVYATAVNAKGVFLGVDALPNLAFVVGLILVFVFGQEHDTIGSSTAPRRLLPRRAVFQIGGSIGRMQVSANSPLELNEDVRPEPGTQRQARGSVDNPFSG